MAENKKGCLGRVLLFVLVIASAGYLIDTVGGPRIKGGTAYVKMDLYLQGAAKNKEWAEKIWTAVRKEKVLKVVILAKAEYIDSYGKSEKVEKEVDITDLISPFSEVRKYTKSQFADEFGDYIVSWVSSRM